jgi:hypothetical protein
VTRSMWNNSTLKSPAASNKLFAFREREFLVRHERHSRRTVVLLRADQVGQELPFDGAEPLLPAREVDRHRPVESIFMAERIFAAVGPS